jgi:hypothetical protein
LRPGGGAGPGPGGGGGAAGGGPPAPPPPRGGGGGGGRCGGGVVEGEGPEDEAVDCVGARVEKVEVAEGVEGAGHLLVAARREAKGEVRNDGWDPRRRLVG